MATPPVPTPVKTFAAIVALVALAGCQPGSTTPRPVPSVAQIGSELKCINGDHGYSDVQAGWGFCYPGTWQYRVRAQSSQSPDPRELDITFDITDVPCSVPSPGATGRPVCSPGAGLYAFMIISTFDRGSSANLAAWEQANPRFAAYSEAIRWGNSVEAARLVDGHRIALTQHRVVIMELHSGAGNLDLEAQMSTRLDTWKFTY